MWEPYKKGFKSYLQLEKSLSDNSVQGYLRDVEHFTVFLLDKEFKKNPADVTLKDLQLFTKWIGELGLSDKSQARMISGLRAFYKYCLLEEITKKPNCAIRIPKTKKGIARCFKF